jgi:phage-related protein
MYRRMKKLTWLADSRSKVKSFPAGVQDDIGYALYAAQLGEMSAKAKPCMVSAAVSWNCGQ